ncbi:hypothetical protein [Hymenobacter sp. PAMC 26628]|uniref:hypothetical protein n=1 Tax=Hymenobacter sp. PAMC 26628 TaxID=1484118 RepID=UPI000770154B|nr:hypothetical protein [Hymenobacter sp. PAMC 26628]AMJ64335.1 hypothetical protein AXW84_02000 [Hymenobacter sp. PAMC 26628]
MRARFFLLPALLLYALAGCKHDAGTAPLCYSGVVLNYDCTAGLLIQVDSQHPIGKSLYPPASSYADSLGSDNVIAAVNLLRSSNKCAQRIYFTYENDPKRQAPDNACPFLGPSRNPAPRLVLGNVSTTPCALP